MNTTTANNSTPPVDTASDQQESLRQWAEKMGVDFDSAEYEDDGEDPPPEFYDDDETDDDEDEF